jgi:hypothetical protein
MKSRRGRSAVKQFNDLPWHVENDGDGGNVDDFDQQTAHFDDAFVLGATSYVGRE